MTSLGPTLILTKVPVQICAPNTQHPYIGKINTHVQSKVANNIKKFVHKIHTQKPVLALQNHAVLIRHRLFHLFLFSPGFLFLEFNWNQLEINVLCFSSSQYRGQRVDMLLCRFLQVFVWTGFVAGDRSINAG